MFFTINWLRVFITMQISLESFRYIAFFNFGEIEEKFIYSDITLERE